MKLPSQELNENLVFIDKPAGLVEKRLGPKLFAFHRLEKNMTGCLVFAKTPEAARIAGQIFRSRRTKMKYLFVTDRASQVDVADPTPYIRFQRIKRSPFFELWEATSSSGRPRQIQVQAAALKLPILGDVSHGGSEFPHLCLHALELEIPSVGQWSSHEPLFMKRLGFLKDRPLVEALSAIDQQQRLFPFLEKSPEEGLLELQLMNNPEIRVDLLGDQLLVAWKKSPAPTSKDQERWNFISQILNKKLRFQQA